MNPIPIPKEKSAIIALLKDNELPFEDLDFNRHKFWLKKESDELIAVCAIEEFGKYGLLRSLSVRKDFQGKENTNLKMRQFDELFLKHHNSVYFRGLLKGDVSIDKERDEIVKDGLFKKKSMSGFRFYCK